NKYFATRERLAYHPRPKNFAGYGIKGTAGAAQASAPPPPPAPKPRSDTLPKDTTAPAPSGDSRKDKLEAYEKEYLARLQQQNKQANVAPPPAPKPNPNRGTMPQGWKPS
ncbi:MAG: trans-sialidase, partial [Candidatus Nitrosotenuis sp.]